jgi:hypothetical protein
MGETSNEGTHLSAGIDLSQFYQVFFEEAGENLETMEQMLLNLDIESPTTKSSTPSSAARTRSRAARPPSASPTWPS